MTQMFRQIEYFFQWIFYQLLISIFKKSTYLIPKKMESNPYNYDGYNSDNYNTDNTMAYNNNQYNQWDYDQD